MINRCVRADKQWNAFSFADLQLTCIHASL
jgi:hypothetical protein